MAEMREELAAAHVVCANSNTSCIRSVDIRRSELANRNDESDTSTLEVSESPFRRTRLRFVVRVVYCIPGVQRRERMREKEEGSEKEVRQQVGRGRGHAHRE